MKRCSANSLDRRFGSSRWSFGVRCETIFATTVATEKLRSSREATQSAREATQRPNTQHPNDKRVKDVHSNKLERVQEIKSNQLKPENWLPCA